MRVVSLLVSFAMVTILRFQPGVRHDEWDDWSDLTFFTTQTNAGVWMLSLFTLIAPQPERTLAAMHHIAVAMNVMWMVASPVLITQEVIPTLMNILQHSTSVFTYALIAATNKSPFFLDLKSSVRIGIFIGIGQGVQSIAYALTNGGNARYFLLRDIYFLCRPIVYAIGAPSILCAISATASLVGMRTHQFPSPEPSLTKGLEKREALSKVAS